MASNSPVAKESMFAETEGKNGVENMISRVASSDATVKSQQRGEPDLTISEKVSILRNIFDISPVHF